MLSDDLDVAIALVVVGHGGHVGSGPRVFGRKSRNEGRRVVLWIGGSPSFRTIADLQRYRTSIVRALSIAEVNSGSNSMNRL